MMCHQSHVFSRRVLALIAMVSVVGVNAQAVGRGGIHAEDARERLTFHEVAPNLTDPAIDQALDNHLAWVDRGVPSNHKLLVFLPGTGVPPSFYQLVQVEGARLGYHVIGLMYANGVPLAGLCARQLDPEACYISVRLQILTGLPQTGLVDVNRANSIDNRLRKLLRYLAATFPQEGWGPFLDHGLPVWPHIVVSGHSQGAGHAALIGQLRLVDRVAMFSGVTDGIGQAASWVTIGATPSDRYYGLAHDGDAFYPVIAANWIALGLGEFGRPRIPEVTNPPYRGTHRLVTELVPADNDAHNSTAVDFITPLDGDGAPLLSDAWDYIFGGLRRRRPDR